MKLYHLIIIALCMTAQANAYECKASGRNKREVITYKTVKLNGQLFLQQTSNQKDYKILSQVKYQTKQNMAVEMGGELSSPPYQVGTYFRLFVFSDDTGLYQVYRGVNAVNRPVRCQY